MVSNMRFVSPTTSILNTLLCLKVGEVNDSYGIQWNTFCKNSAGFFTLCHCHATCAFRSYICTGQTGGGESDGLGTARADDGLLTKCAQQLHQVGTRWGMKVSDSASSWFSVDRDYFGCCFFLFICPKSGLKGCKC